LDGPEFAESALMAAAQLARRWEAEVDLVRVTAPILTSAPELHPNLGYEFTQQAQAAAQVYLDNLIAPLSGLTVHTHSLVGSPKEEIAELAGQLAADLIVMASHGRSGIARWLMGSTAEYVLRHAPCPVLLLRPSLPCSGHFEHILVPVDGSAASREVVMKIAPYLGAGGKVTVMRASGLTAREYTLLNNPDEITTYLVHLNQQIGKIAAPGLAVEHAVIDGEAVQSIVDYAQQHQCDLVAMSTHGRTGFRRFVLGSVTEKVSRQAPCPVLAFPQHPPP
jgi:nucleotide-binding universal stress UspA family protein